MVNDVDVAWIGQSLHHLDTAVKGNLMRRIRKILDEEGLFLIWEPTLLDGETQAGWIPRWETGSRPLWHKLGNDDWNAMLSHVRSSDRPETSTVWRQLGLDAGFKEALEIYTAPTRLARVYCFAS